jgi:hypothetical protein
VVRLARKGVLLKPNLFLSGIFVALVSLTGCGKSPPREVFPVKVDVVHQLSEGSWYLEYRFPEPVQGLVFVRQQSQVRSSHWTILDPGVRFHKTGAGEIVYSMGAGIGSVRMKVRPYYHEAPRDYELFVPFSDGSHTLYTGQLDILPLVCRAVAPCAPEDLVEKPTI